jgi:hypothetical protein
MRDLKNKIKLWSPTRDSMRRQLPFLRNKPKWLWPALLIFRLGVLPKRLHFFFECVTICILASKRRQVDGLLEIRYSNDLAQRLRRTVLAQLKSDRFSDDGFSLEDLFAEFFFLSRYRLVLKPVFRSLASRRALYSGQAYYNSWYLSRALRKLGWKADVLNWDLSASSQIFYHGEDFRFFASENYDILRDLKYFMDSIYDYDIFHFSNIQGICFGFPLQRLMASEFGEHSEIYLLKSLGKKTIYSNNGCMDGVSQTSFSKWGPESVCGICRWQNEPSVCSDIKNLEWGRFRNAVSDYQCLLGGNRADFNFAPTVHEAPEFYCLDPDFWHPALEIPAKFRLAPKEPSTLRVYHAVGNKSERTRSDGVNIKSSHIYGPLIEKLRAAGFSIETLEPTGIPNKEVRFIQAQADIFLEMLTFGWFGANAREAMMLGKPVICFIRPEWLDSLRVELPEYADELPVISATPDTVEDILRELLLNPERRNEIGARSREFAVKWHSSHSGARRFDEIYSRLLKGDPLLLESYR